MKAIIFPLKIVHWVVVVYNLTGWLAASQAWLMAYLVFVPIMVIHWRLNNNTCILNNVETWIESGKWRNEGNPEEGAFVHTALQRALGWAPPKKLFDQLIYVVMLILWTVAYFKWRGM